MTGLILLCCNTVTFNDEEESVALVALADNILAIFVMPDDKTITNLVLLYLGEGGEKLDFGEKSVVLSSSPNYRVLDNMVECFTVEREQKTPSFRDDGRGAGSVVKQGQFAESITRAIRK